LDGVLAMVGKVGDVDEIGEAILCEELGGAGSNSTQDNPRPFFDSLAIQRKSGAESANSRTWYQWLRSHATESNK
jgi:hypothetical protein